MQNSQPGSQPGALQSPNPDLAPSLLQSTQQTQHSSPSHLSFRSSQSLPSAYRSDQSVRSNSQSLHSPATSAASSFHPPSYAPTSLPGGQPHSNYLAQASSDPYSLYSQHQPQAGSWIPYAATNSASPFSTPDSSENMAAPHTMRPSMPNIYQHPQSISPSSAHAQDSSARLMYGNPHQANLYFNSNYSLASQPPYMQHHSQQQHHLGSPSLPVSYGQPSALQPSPIHESPRSLAQLPLHRGSAQLNSHVGATGHGTAGLSSTGRHGSSGGSTSSAPGPIPATTPLVITEGDDGIQRIIFEYSRDRVKVPYTIKCNVESIDHNELSREFKEANCVYPRACNFQDHNGYKGNRFEYETQCNRVGWALAALNPELRGKRGLIQRAVDSWRNSASDVKLRSRRVRRLAKNHKRNSQGAALPHGMPLNRPAGMTSMGHPQDALSMHGSTQHSHQLAQSGRADHTSGMLQHY